MPVRWRETMLALHGLGVERVRRGGPRPGAHRPGEAHPARRGARQCLSRRSSLRASRAPARSQTAAIMSVATELPAGSADDRRARRVDSGSARIGSSRAPGSASGVGPARRAADRLRDPRRGAALQDAPASAAEDVDLVIVATMSQDELTPNAAPLVAHALGADRAGAFDVGAACTAFLSGLSLGAAQIESGRADCVLLSAPTSSRGSPTTTTGAPRRCSPTPPAPSCSATAAASAARSGRSCSAPTARAASLHLRQPRRAQDPDGRARGVPARGRADGRGRRAGAVAAPGLTLDDIDLFVYHQANARITRALGERLGLDARARRRLHRDARQRLGGDAAAGARRGRAGRSPAPGRAGAARARSAPASPGAAA